MIKNQPVLGIAACMIFVFGAANAVLAQLPDTESIASLHSLSSQIAAYDPSRKALRFFSPSGGGLSEKKSLAIDGNVMGVAEIPEGYLIATGMSREDRAAPIRITRVSRDGSRSSIVFEFSGERNQINRIMSRGNKIWLDFFDSKYFTKVGYLSPNAQAPWPFTEAASVRMGDSLEVVDDSVFVGRSYGEVQGQDGDLLLFSNGQRTTLPSYRGVRALVATEEPSGPEIVVADGWHQNYGQFAQGRISRLRRFPDTGRYGLEIVAIDADNYGFSKLLALPDQKTSKVVALGNAYVSVFDLKANGEKQVVHKLQHLDRVSDLAVATSPGGSPCVVVLDGGLHVYSDVQKPVPVKPARLSP